MGNVSTTILKDKDIKTLEVKSTQYKRVVGEPKELHVWINPSGMKTFFIKYKTAMAKKLLLS